MIDQPTPETDALVAKWDYSPIPKVMEAHARKLEMERDEARDELRRIDNEVAFDAAWSEEKMLHEAVAIIIRQRDELLAALEAYRGQVANDGKSGYAEAAIAAVKGTK